MFEKLSYILNSDDKYQWGKFYEELENANCIDDEYLQKTRGKNIDVIKDEIDNMELSEVYTWLTWILRGERFCEGLFETKKKDGTLFALIARGKAREAVQTNVKNGKTYL